MAQDNPPARAHGSVSLDDPTQALMQDHDYIRQLFQRYLSTEDDRMKQQAGPQICEALHRHTTLEEAVFYPRVQHLDPALIARCEDDHHQADEFLLQLQKLKPGESAYDGLMQQLRDAIIAHIEVEERQLFPAVRSSSMNLQDLSLRMQAYESNLISTQAASSKGAARANPMH